VDRNLQIMYLAFVVKEYVFYRHW